jgi:hypothetical protein
MRNASVVGDKMIRGSSEITTNRYKISFINGEEWYINDTIVIKIF